MLENPNEFVVYLFVLVAAPLFLLARVYPIWNQRFQGCDAYNILLNAEFLRKRRGLPIKVPPIFMLEDTEQWYPPGFLIFCALLPEKWLLRRYWLINHLVDLGSALLVYVAALWFGAGPVAGAIAMLFYAIASGSVSEFASLNVRPFGLLIFNGLLLAGFAASQDPRWIVAAGLLCVALFYSHKLSAQQLWFTFPVLAWCTGEWFWGWLLLATYGLAFLIWPRGAWRILRGHWVIIRFWQRHWPLLGAHAVRQSPIYGDGTTNTQFYRNQGFADYVSFAKDVLHQNYFVLPLLVALATSHLAWDPALMFLLGWVASVYVAAAAIHCLKFLRGIGLARQYIKFALVPSLVFSAVVMVRDPSVLVWATGLLAAGLSLRQYWLVTRTLRTAAPGAAASENTELDYILSSIEADDQARVLALPVHLCDLIAYRVRKPVYWGTHSDVFDERLGDFFPVLRHRLAHYARDGVNRVLLDRRYVTPAELGLEENEAVASAGPYLTFHLDVGPRC